MGGGKEKISDTEKSNPQKAAKKIIQPLSGMGQKIGSQRKKKDIIGQEKIADRQPGVQKGALL